MAWSLSYQSIRKPELVEELLLAAGKALYLANSFESKCKYVLRMFNLVATIEADPVLTLEQAIAALPQDEMLGGTLQHILRRGIGDDSATTDALDGARNARNFIAHEGAEFGDIWGLRTRRVAARATLLRSAVDDLIAGDNVVSARCYEINEREPAPEHFKAAYPTMVDDWVFGRLDIALASVDPADDREPTLRERLGLTEG